MDLIFHVQSSDLDTQRSAPPPAIERRPRRETDPVGEPHTDLARTHATNLARSSPGRTCPLTPADAENNRSPGHADITARHGQETDRGAVQWPASAQAGSRRRDRAGRNAFSGQVAAHTDRQRRMPRSAPRARARGMRKRTTNARPMFAAVCARPSWRAWPATTMGRRRRPPAAAGGSCRRRGVPSRRRGG